MISKMSACSVERQKRPIGVNEWALRSSLLCMALRSVLMPTQHIRTRG